MYNISKSDKSKKEGRMKDNQRLPDAELEIMMAIWDANETVTSEYLMEVLNKDWVKPTLLNLLNRLVHRGFVKCEKVGKINYYTAIEKKEKYLQRESKNFLKQMHQNSISSLLVSLYGGKKLSKKEVEELDRFIEEAK